MLARKGMYFGKTGMNIERAWLIDLKFSISMLFFSFFFSIHDDDKIIDHLMIQGLFTSKLNDLVLETC